MGDHAAFGIGQPNLQPLKVPTGLAEFTLHGKEPSQQVPAILFRMVVLVVKPAQALSLGSQEADPVVKIHGQFAFFNAAGHAAGPQFRLREFLLHQHRQEAKTARQDPPALQIGSQRRTALRYQSLVDPALALIGRCQSPLGAEDRRDE